MSAFPRSFRLVLPMALLLPACPGDDVTPSDTDGDDSTSTGDGMMTMTTATTMTTADDTTTDTSGGLDTTTGPDDDDDDSTTTMGDDDDDSTTTMGDDDDDSSTTSSAMCGDDMVGGDEQCDGTDLDGEDCMTQGFDGGTLACDDECNFDTTGCVSMTCGNDMIEGMEQCDGDELGGEDCASQGFVDGLLSCGDDCNFDTSGCNSCGNDAIDGDDVCDGTDLGGEDCTTQGFMGGTLACADDCTGYDTSMCTGASDCCESNGTPGCDDPTCSTAVCDQDSFCCDTTWDGLCANLANGFCDVCMGGMGDCCSANGSQGCDDIACVADLCGAGGAGETACCDTDWDQSCADIALADCAVCVPPNCGDGVLDMDEVCDGMDLGGETCVSQGFKSGTLGCADNCNALDTSGCFTCGNDMVEGPEDCDGADLGGADCGSVGFVDGTLACAMDCTFDTSMCTTGSGDCCSANMGSPGCDDPACVMAVCAEDPFCCGTNWDGLCANVANGYCDVCMGGMGDCCSANGSQGCDDVACVVDLCGVGGAGQVACCDTDWDQSCADTAVADCAVCVPPNCGDGVLDMDEVCDMMDLGGETCVSQGFDSGTLGCEANCNAFDTSGCGTCGNGLADGDELCDAADLGGEDCVSQGFDSGTLMCNGTCDGYDTSACGTCGNGVIDGAEACDMGDLGGEDCASLGLGGGTLACDADCNFDGLMCDIPGLPFGSDSGYTGIEQPPGMTTCDEISATGTPTGQSDDSTVTVPLGFSFPFYGTDVTEVNVDSNGAIRFGETAQTGFGNVCLPGPDNTLFVFWDDLNPAAAGDIFTETLGMPGDQRFVVQYDVPNFGGDPVDLMRIQVMLSEATGNIDVCYVDTVNGGNSADSGAEATAGIQLDGMSSIEYSCNTPDLVDGLQLTYLPN